MKVAETLRRIGQALRGKAKTPNSSLGPNVTAAAPPTVAVDLGPNTRVLHHSVRGRPASTYRGGYWSRPSRPEMRRGLPHQYDRATARSIMRAQERKIAGRWDGKGDPGIVVSLRAQEKPKTRRRVKSV